MCLNSKSTSDSKNSASNAPINLCTSLKSSEKLISVIKFVKKLDFADSVIIKGAQYLGFHTSSLSSALANNPHDDAYILFFNGYVRCHCNLQNEDYALLLELLEDKVEEKLVLVVDCNAFDQNMEKSYISHTAIGVLL